MKSGEKTTGMALLRWTLCWCSSRLQRYLSCLKYCFVLASLFQPVHSCFLYLFMLLAGSRLWLSGPKVSPTPLMCGQALVTACGSMSRIISASNASNNLAAFHFVGVVCEFWLCLERLRGARSRFFVRMLVIALLDCLCLVCTKDCCCLYLLRSSALELCCMFTKPVYLAPKTIAAH